MQRPAPASLELLVTDDFREGSAYLLLGTHTRKAKTFTETLGAYTVTDEITGNESSASAEWIDKR